MTIRIERLEAGEWACRWICKIFSEKSCWDALPESCKTKEWIEELYHRFEQNEIIGYVGFVTGVPAGLFWSAPWESGIWSGHQFVLEKFRGQTAYDMVEKCVEAFFEDVPRSTHVVGFIKKSNRASVFCALKAGFRKCGTMPNYMGEEDCWMVVRQREEKQE